MKRMLIAALCVLWVVTACSSPSEIASEQILENIEGVDDVNIDADTGEIKLETEDGSFSFGGGEIPEDLEIAVPDGGEVLVTLDSPDGISVSLEYDINNFDSVVEFYAGWVAADSGEWNHSSSTFNSDGGETITAETWLGDGRSIHVTSCPSSVDTSGDVRGTCVSLIQEK